MMCDVLKKSTSLNDLKFKKKRKKEIFEKAKKRFYKINKKKLNIT